MIDFENCIYTEIATRLRTKYGSDFYVAGEYVKAPPKFPAVYIIERYNAVNIQTQDSGSRENHANVMYEIYVFSNLTQGKKTQCKEIFKEIDEVLASLGFTRRFKEPIPNLEDSTIYQMIGRYSATISTDGIIYRG